LGLIDPLPRAAVQQGVAADHQQQLGSIDLGRCLAASLGGKIGSGQPCCWPLNADPLGRPKHGTRLVRITIFQIKFVHTLIFWVLSLCVAYALFSGVANRITLWTWVAVGLLFVERVVLVVSGWTCPLTILVERRGEVRGSVTDIFLPRWFADRVFPICGTLYGIALLIIVLRVAL